MCLSLLDLDLGEEEEEGEFEGANEENIFDETGECMQVHVHFQLSAVNTMFLRFTYPIPLM